MNPSLCYNGLSLTSRSSHHFFICYYFFAQISQEIEVDQRQFRSKALLKELSKNQMQLNYPSTGNNLAKKVDDDTSYGARALAKFPKSTKMARSMTSSRLVGICEIYQLHHTHRLHILLTKSHLFHRLIEFFPPSTLVTFSVCRSVSYLNSLQKKAPRSAASVFDIERSPTRSQFYFDLDKHYTKEFNNP